MDVILNNMLLIFVIVIIALKIKYGLKEGFTQGLYRVVVTIFGIIVIILAIKLIRNIITHTTVGTINNIICLLAILLIYKILNLPLTSLKLIAKTPGLNILDKILSIPFALAESILVIWIIFFVNDLLKIQILYQWMIEQINNSDLLLGLFANNYLENVINIVLKL